MKNTLVFLSDYEAAEEFEAVFNLLRPHGIEGILAKPKDVIVASVNGNQHFFFKGHKLSPTLVIGYAYEDDLLPSMRLLTQFREAGIKVLNDGETLYYGQHKDVSSMRLSASTDIKHMPYMMCSADLVHHIIDTIGFPCVAKPINGACGLGLYKFDDEASFRAWISAPVAAVGMNSGSHRDYYVQPYIEKNDGVDYRIACIGHQAVYAYERRSSNGGWVTNLSSNGLGKIVSLDILGNEALRMAESASRAIGSLFCGVDLAFDIHGQPFIIEANTCPAIKISRYIPGACDGLERAFATYLLENHLNQKTEKDKQ